MYSGSVFYDFSLIFSQITGVELVILALLGDQLVVAAALDDAALLQNHDAVCIADGRQAVGNDKAGAAIHQAVHAPLDQCLSAGINGGGRLVQDQHRGIGNRGAGNGQQLALPLRQVCTVVGQHGVVAIGQTLDKAFKNGTSINPETPEEVDEVVETLKAQKPLVQAYVMDEIFDKMIGGEAAIGVYYSGDAITMIDDNPDLAWVFPEEGSVLSVDCMAVPATSEHKEAAEMFINFMCEPDIGKANAEYIGYTTPMQKVWDILDEDLKYSEIAYPSEEVEAKEKVFTALSDEVNNELDVKWSEMKSYNEGGSGVVFLLLLLAMVALACFNIWRKLRKKTRNQY